MRNMERIDYKSEIKGNENIEFVYPQTPDAKIISTGWLFPTIAMIIITLLVAGCVALYHYGLDFCSEQLLAFLIIVIALLLVAYMVYRVTVVQITKLNEQQILEISSRRKMIEAAITNVISLQVEQIKAKQQQSANNEANNQQQSANNEAKNQQQ